MYVNHGDMHFFESGMLIDDSHGITDIRFIQCEPLYDDFGDDEMRYYFAAGSVDCTDTWMNVDAVMDYTDLADIATIPEFARACIDYYGGEEFSCDWDVHVMTRPEIERVINRCYWASIDKTTVSFE